MRGVSNTFWGHGWRSDAVALGIVGLGFLLRVGSLGDYWNSADEGIYYHVAHAPWEIARSIVALNSHPPLYYYVLRAVGAGTDEFLALRVPALICGTLAIYALYRLGARLGGPICGWVAAALLALSPGAITLSQVARPYALESLALIAAATALLRFFQERGRRALVAYTAWMLLAMALHYCALLAIGGFGVALVGATSRFSRRELRDLAVAHLPLLLVAAWLYFSHIQPVLLDSMMLAEARGSRFVTYFTTEPAALWLNFVELFGFLAGPELAAVSAIACLAALAACLRRRPLLVLWPFGTALLVAVAASAASLYPFGGTRHSGYLLPWLVVPMGVAASLAASRGWRVVLPVVCLLAVAVFARAPLGSLLGVPAEGFAVEPEFEMPAAELDSLVGALEGVSATPGLVFVDLSTAYTLLPLLGEPALRARWLATPGIARLPWGERTVVVIPYWYLAVGRGPQRENHLAVCIRRVIDDDPELAALLGDTRVISAGGRGVPREIRRLASGHRGRQSLVSELSRTLHLAVFRLEANRYLALLREGGRQPVTVAETS